MRLLAIIGAIALGYGCGGADSCELEAGLYQQHFVVISGSCGELPSTEIAVADGTLPVFGNGPNCAANTSSNDDGCGAVTSADCFLEGGSGELHVEGVTSYVSPTEAEADVSIRVDFTDGSQCTGRYRIVYRRL